MIRTDRNLPELAEPDRPEPADQDLPELADRDLPELADLDDLDALDELDGGGTDLPAGGTGAAVTVDHNDGQVANVVYGGLHQYVQRVRDYHELSAEYVRDRLAGFVDPGYRTVAGDRLTAETAVARMRRDGGVILVGGPGTGRYTAALRLLHGTGLRLREIRPTFDPARGEQLTIAELPVAPGYAYLLELPEHAPHIRYGFARDIAAYCDSLARRGSAIAVTVTGTTWEQLGAVRDGPVLHVAAPPADLVLGRRLHQLRPDLALDWLTGQPQIAELLVDASPAEAVRLAQLAADVLTAQPGPAGPPVTAGTDAGRQLVEALVSAYRNWEVELTAWFHHHPDPRHRAFLVAAAALEGAPAGRVLSAAEALDARLAGTDAPPASLGHAGVRTLVETVDAYLDDDHTVRYRRARYAEAVLDFVITDRADTFQRELWRWVSELPLRGGQRRGPVDRALATRSAELVLHTALRRRTPEILSQVAPAWSRRAGLRGALVHVLGIAALSPEIGAAVRQQLYRWAQGSSNPAVLIAVAEVCGGEFADFYVEQAMVRLGHLARHDIAEVDEAVLTALAALWRRPALRQPVLLRLAHWLADDQPRRAALAAVALNLLGRPEQPRAGDGPAHGPVDPAHGPADQPTGPQAPVRQPDRVLAELVVATPVVQDAIGVALGRVLDVRQLPGSVEALLHRWFDDAAADPGLVDALTHVLGRTVTAGPAAARRVARLRALLTAWPATDDPARQAELRRHLVDQLRRANPIAARPRPAPLLPSLLSSAAEEL
ncbi:hypothetical protein O7543_25490 [Solwaraspora sp. WMMA2080]|uniref:hypothetical protein n=1 Tax=unclassified Solwaraspora TaxID=2627926 RepID=UPI00248BE12E|nr:MULTISPECIES: hypothetical protein [unclassified Solwaraspora]WBB95981.1 hypothetical protein O7553_21885 [Solwaraspora sp. WMMA2059]WBC20115.1 hypothetical protein O7543_25490 [Solwaraspora sp. WMMA2080]